MSSLQWGPGFQSPQSARSVAANLGAVSLYDFDSESQEDLATHLFDFKLTPIMVRIRRANTDPAKLVAPLEACPVALRLGRMFIPYTEYRIGDHVPIGSFDRIVLTDLDELWREYAPADFDSVTAEVERLGIRD